MSTIPQQQPIKTVRGREVAVETVGGEPVRIGERECSVTGELFRTFESVPPPAAYHEPTPPMWASHFSAPEKFARIFNAHRWGVHSTPDPAGEALADELLRLRGAKFHHVASLIEASVKVAKAARPAGHLFELGEVLVATHGPVLLNLTADEVAGFVDRHAKGDAGELGADWHELEISDDQATLNHRHSPDVQNAATLKSGRGLIRSRYSAYRPGVDDPKPHDVSQTHGRRRNRGETVEILTLVGPGGPKTLVFTSLEPAV